MIGLSLVSKVSKEVVTQNAENCCRRQPSCCLTAPPRGTHIPYISRNKSLTYIFVSDSMGLPSFTFLWWLQTTRLFCNRVLIGRSRSSKVDDFSSNRKRVCDFLLVRHSNLGPLLSCTVSEIRLLLAEDCEFFLTPLLFNAKAIQTDLFTFIFSRSYCYTIWSASAIGIVLLSVCLSVCLQGCEILHCGSQNRCTGLKVVPGCSKQASSYLSLQNLLL